MLTAGLQLINSKEKGPVQIWGNHGKYSPSYALYCLKFPSTLCSILQKTKKETENSIHAWTEKFLGLEKKLRDLWLKIIQILDTEVA